MSDTVSDATEETEPAGVPAVRTPYHLGGPVASGMGLPFLRLAHSRIGMAGRSLGWAQLQAAGIRDGELYAAGGWLDEPERLAEAPCLLLACRRVAYTQEEATYRRLGERVIQAAGEAGPGELQAVDALLLVLPAAGEPLAGVFGERTRPAIHHASTVIGPWLKRLSKAPAVGGLPVWARVCARLRSEGGVGRDTGFAYRREIVDLGALSAPELARLAEWLPGPGGARLPARIEAWLAQTVAPQEPAADGPDIGDQIPF